MKTFIRFIVVLGLMVWGIFLIIDEEPSMLSISLYGIAAMTLFLVNDWLDEGRVNFIDEE